MQLLRGLCSERAPLAKLAGTSGDGAPDGLCRPGTSGCSAAALACVAGPVAPLACQVGPEECRAAKRCWQWFLWLQCGLRLARRGGERMPRAWEACRQGGAAGSGVSLFCSGLLMQGASPKGMRASGSQVCCFYIWGMLGRARLGDGGTGVVRCVHAQPPGTGCWGAACWEAGCAGSLGFLQWGGRVRLCTTDGGGDARRRHYFGGEAVLSCWGLLPRLGSTQVSLKRCRACFAMMLDSLGMCWGLLCLSYGGTRWHQDGPRYDAVLVDRIM